MKQVNEVKAAIEQCEETLNSRKPIEKNTSARGDFQGRSRSEIRKYDIKPRNKGAGPTSEFKRAQQRR